MILAPDEVVCLLEAARPGRDRVQLQTTYTCGLRVEELLHLQVADIDSARMFVIVRQGKGRKDRLVPLSQRLLTELRAYWRVYRPRTWLFPGVPSNRPLHAGTVQRMMQANAAGGRHRQAGDAAHAEAFLRDALARGRRRSGHAAEAARPPID